MSKIFLVHLTLHPLVVCIASKNIVKLAQDKRAKGNSCPMGATSKTGNESYRVELVYLNFTQYELVLFEARLEFNINFFFKFKHNLIQAHEQLDLDH